MTGFPSHPPRGPRRRRATALVTVTAAWLGVAVLAVAPPGSAVPSAHAAKAVKKVTNSKLEQVDPAATVVYLQAAQNRDGGFAPQRGRYSQPPLSVWAGLAVAAAGINPKDQTVRGGKRLWPYLEAQAPKLVASDDVARLALVAVAAGQTPRSVGTTDPITTLLARQTEAGGIADRDGTPPTVTASAWGLLALVRADGEDARMARTRAADWLRTQQRQDGGWSAVADGPSRADVSAIVLQALAADGDAPGETLERGRSFLAGLQAGGRRGGVRAVAGGRADPVSTAFAYQAVTATGGRHATVFTEGPDPLTYLADAQKDDGSVGSATTAVLVSAQVTPGFFNVALPVRARSRGAATNSGPNDRSPATTSTPTSGGSGKGSGGGTGGSGSGSGSGSGAGAGGQNGGASQNGAGAALGAGGGAASLGGSAAGPDDVDASGWDDLDDDLSADLDDDINATAPIGGAADLGADPVAPAGDDPVSDAAVPPPTTTGAQPPTGGTPDGAEVSGTVVGATDRVADGRGGAGAAAGAGGNEGGGDTTTITLALGGVMLLFVVLGAFLERRPARLPAEVHG